MKKLFFALTVALLFTATHSQAQAQLKPQGLTLTTGTTPTKGIVLEVRTDQNGQKSLIVEFSKDGKASVFTVYGDNDLLGIGSRLQTAEISFFGNKNAKAGLILQFNTAYNNAASNGLALIGLDTDHGGKFSSSVNFGLVSDGTNNAAYTAGNLYYAPIKYLTLGIGAGCLNKKCQTEIDFSVPIKKVNFEFNVKKVNGKAVSIIGLQWHIK